MLTVKGDALEIGSKELPIPLTAQINPKNPQLRLSLHVHLQLGEMIGHRKY